MSNSHRVAFVLQGGGSLSAPQIGMLRALFEAGVTPDLLVGSSAGALNAVAFATDPTLDGLEKLEALWMRLRRRNVASVTVGGLVRALTGRADGLLSAAPLTQLLARTVAPRLEETCLPAHVVATDLRSGAPVVLSEGNSVPALLASAAFPGLYAPVPIDGALLSDGGVATNIPVLQAEALGAEVCYVLPAAISADIRVRGPLAMAYRALGQILDAAARRDTAAAAGAVQVLDAPATRATNPLDFRWTAQLINEGYNLTTAWLQQCTRQSSLPFRSRQAA
jgi:NTE family protein